MPRTSRIDEADNAMENAEDALAGRLSYDKEMADLMIADVCTTKQAHETLESMQPDPQAHIYHIELRQLRAELLAAKTECDDARAVPIQQKDILMQEAHHRIKNSLQLVQSLLYLQASETVSQTASRQLYESAARIRVIGAMHDRLYRSETMQEVEVKPYLKALVKDLRTGMASAVSDRLILLHADEAILAAADIPTLGLVLTELVTNALKYGTGTINVSFYQEPDRQAVLIVEDEGALAPDFNLELASGFGMRLIQSLVGQRDGSVIVDGAAKNTRFIAVLPRPRNGSFIVKTDMSLASASQTEEVAA